MGDIGDIKKRMIYGFLFKNNTIYIGLTYKIEMREKQHLNLDDDKKKSAVKDYIRLTGETPKLIKFTNYLPYKQAQQKENDLVNQYKEKGFTVLNKAKTGGLGASFTVSDKQLKDEALKYQTRKEFNDKNHSWYTLAQKRGILNDITKHMQNLKLFWTPESIRSEALKYQSLKDFRELSPKAYAAAKYYGKDFYEDVTKHMENKKTKYTDDELKSEILNYTSAKQLRKENPKLWSAIYRRLGNQALSDFFNE